MSSSLLLWIVSQKRFVLRMKLIQCEIKSPVLYLREAHRGHSWWWASRLFPSVLTALQATCACVCTGKHALPTQHNTGTLTVLMLHSNYLTSQSMTFLFRFSFWPEQSKALRDQRESTQRTSSAFHCFILFFLFDSRVQSKCLEDLL